MTIKIIKVEETTIIPEDDGLPTHPGPYGDCRWAQSIRDDMVEPEFNKNRAVKKFEIETECGHYPVWTRDNRYGKLLHKSAKKPICPFCGKPIFWENIYES